jgi:hypothetical protein
VTVVRGSRSGSSVSGGPRGGIGYRGGVGASFGVGFFFELKGCVGRRKR